MKLSEIMNKAVAVDEDIQLKNAVKIMSERGIGSLIVMKKDKIVGIVTERDILRNVNKLNIRISQVMSKKVISINDNETVDNAALMMAKYRIKRLPVLKNEKLVGIITATDIIANSESLNERFLIE